MDLMAHVLAKMVLKVQELTMKVLMFQVLMAQALVMASVVWDLMGLKARVLGMVSKV